MSAAWWVVAASAIAVSQVAAQKPQLQIQLPEREGLASEAPLVLSAALISDGSTRDLLVNGFPARLRYRMERWEKGRWFDDLRATTEWDVLVRYDPLARDYRVYRAVGDLARLLGIFADVRGADGAVGAPFRAPISHASAGRRTYYTLSLEIETLSLTELDEVERWLRGELQPAVRGEKNPGTAVSRGLRTAVVRLLGGEKRRYETRSGTFRP